jgi:hypothetical protein
MMLRCWRSEPGERPTFFNLSKDLDTILGPQDTQDRYHHTRADEDEDDYMNLYMNVEAPEGIDIV